MVWILLLSLVCYLATGDDGWMREGSSEQSPSSMLPRMWQDGGFIS
jgi:hypothetical protein